MVYSGNFPVTSTGSQKSIDRFNFLNLRKIETERDTSEKHALDLQEIYQFNLSFFVVSPLVPKLPRIKKIGAVNTFLTASVQDCLKQEKNCTVHQTCTG